MSLNERRPRKSPHVASTEDSGRTTPTSVDSFTKDTPVDYLFKNNVTNIMTESVNSLIMNKPDDPIQFLVDYFASSSYDVVNEAYMKLSWSHFGRKSYQRNILEVYNTMVSFEDKNSQLCGLLGDRFNELLRKLSDDLPEHFGKKCMDKLRARDTQMIVFDRFYHAVLLLHVMKDFIRTVQAVYRDLDFGNMGKASEALCKLILSKLQANKNRRSTREGVALLKDELQKMSLSPTESNGSSFDFDDTLITDLQEMVESAFVSSSSSDQLEYMEKEAFVDKAVQIFLDKV